MHTVSICYLAFCYLNVAKRNIHITGKSIHHDVFKSEQFVYTCCVQVCRHKRSLTVTEVIDKFTLNTFWKHPYNIIQSVRQL